MGRERGMMDEEIRRALCEVREMKKMCGNINMKLTNIVTQRGQDYKKKLEAEYQRGFEDGKWKSEDGCTGCKYEGKTGEHLPCDYCMNNFKNQWTAKDDKIEVGDEVAFHHDDSLGAFISALDAINDFCDARVNDRGEENACKDCVLNDYCLNIPSRESYKAAFMSVDKCMELIGRAKEEIR